MQKNREIVFQLLYSRGFENSEAGISMVMRLHSIPKKAAFEAKEKADAVWEVVEKLDQIIEEKTSEYTLDRIPKVEQTVLRLGLYEMLYDDLPPKVAISEAIRLAKKFATAEASSFVNALLDRVYKEREHEVSTEEQTSIPL